MATSESTIDFLLDQLSGADAVRARKMFGEYALYCNEKVVALVCDNMFFLKPTRAGKTLLKHVEEAPPYPGARMYYLIEEEYWEDREWFSEIISKTAEELPAPKRKK